MGGFPGMPTGDDDEDNNQQQSTNNERYYEILGLKKGASIEDIKQAYKKLARQLHPDRHPNETEKYHQKFTELQEAYEVLNDPEKKKLYDRYGEAGLKGGGGSGMDIFDMFFGGGRGRGRASQRQQKAPPVNVFLDITLEDCYIGSTKKIKYDQMVICKECEGKGGKKVKECPTCNGTGSETKIQRMGNITMQTQKECSKCDGQGTIILDSDRCKKCASKGMSKISKEVEITLQRGCKNADKIVLRGQGHEVANAANGDVIVILRVAKHDVFQRIGADLAMTQHISLKEAVCGFDIKIPHLSGSILRLKSRKGEIVQPSQLKCVREKGMPQKGSAVYGNLYVKVEIDFPKTGDLSSEALEQIAQLLPENKEDDKEEKKDIKTEKDNKKEKQSQKKRKR